MFITSQKEILSIMPTAKWSRPERLYGWIQEEEESALIPLLGQSLYETLQGDYKRLIGQYDDITAMHIRPDGTIITSNGEDYIAERTDDLGNEASSDDSSDEEESVGTEDMARIRLIRLCQQIEFYEMLGHKMGLLSTSFNEGGVNRVGANNYDAAEEKDMERAAKDAFMSAKRATDNLLNMLERDARGSRYFTDEWKEADYYYMRSDLLFTTARTMQEYYNLGGSREKYITLVKDIRFCQNIYIKPRLGSAFLAALIQAMLGEETESEETTGINSDVLKETIGMLRQSLAMYIEARQDPKTKNPMSATMADAEQALSTTIEYIREHQSDYGDTIKSSPLYQEEETAAEAESNPCQQDNTHNHEVVGDCSDSPIFTFPMGGIVEPW